MSSVESPTPQQYAEAAIGWPLFADGSLVENLADLDGERAHIALAGIARVVDSRNAEARVAQEQFGMELTTEQLAKWWPTPIAVEQYNKDLHRERKNLQILQGIETRMKGYQDGSVVTELRDYQYEVMSNLHDFIVGTRHDRSLPKGCSFILPTGMGKTAGFIELTVAAKSREDRKEPVRTLVLTPTRDLMSQTVDAYNEWAPDLDVGVAWQEEKEMDKEVVVMVVDTFLNMIERGELRKEHFDLGILDEFHKMIGPETMRRINEFFDDKLVVGCTASPDYDEIKSVRAALPPVFEKHLPEALRDEKRWLAPLQTGVILARVTSDIVKKVLREKQKGRTLSDDEIRKLAEREATMQTALELIKTSLEDGVQALGKFAPGDDVEEAKEAARRLNEMTMVDPKTGEERNIIAVAIPGTMPLEERRAYYRLYNQGDIDVLTFVRVLGMGWNSKKAKCLVDADPGASIVDKTQALGRITRQLIDEETGREIIGRAYSVTDGTTPKGFVTFGQIAGQTVNNPNEIIGVREEDLANYDLPQLPEHLQRALDEWDGCSFDELTASSLSKLAHTIERAAERADQLISIGRARLILGLTEDDQFVTLAEKHHVPLLARLRRQYVRWGELANIVREEEGLRQRFRPVEGGYHLLEAIAEELEVDLTKLERQLRTNRVPIISFVDENGLPGRYLSREQKARVVRAAKQKAKGKA